ncbi:MAG: TlpA family protein disulfide reductase [Chromatiaceae bacterium]|nr:TlpA family protein disulfide reductase [Chromatiaceae bacterium]
MANNLTGDYEAVAEVRVKAINGILATLHQNGASKDASPSFLHCAVMQVGYPPKIELHRISDLIRWAGRFGYPPPDSGTAPHGGNSMKAPPGVSDSLKDAIAEAYDARKILTTPIPVRGIAQVQLGSPRISAASDSTSEVTAHVDIRANYIPESDTQEMPKPVHGEVRITFSVMPKSLPGYGAGTKVLSVEIPADDAKIQYTTAPGSGLTSGEVNKIEKQIRKAVRSGFEPINTELPPGFEFDRFKALGSGSSQVLALPVTLSGGLGPAASAVGGITNKFLNSSDDFAIGVSKEYILSLVQPSLNAIKSSHPKFTVSGWLGSATYTTTFQQVTASWKNEKIHLYIKGTSTTPTWWAPNVGSFVITQDLGLQLNASSQTLDIVPVGQPSVSVNVNGPFGGLVSGAVTPTVRSAFIDQRDAALTAATSQIQQTLAGGGIDDALHAFDDSADARFKALDTTGDGMILRGVISTKGRSSVVVKVTETGDGEGFTALKSWIPGGVIDEFQWSWRESQSLYLPWSSTIKTATDKHSFILPKPDGVSFTSQICLRVKGTRAYPGWSQGVQTISIGTEVPVEAGETCNSRSSDPGMVATMPSWWDVIMTPIWLPDPPPEAFLDDYLAGHLNLLRNSWNPGEQGANCVVHFPDMTQGNAFDGLDQAFARSGQMEAPMALILVLPQGSFTDRRWAVEGRLGALKEEFSGSVSITEDYQGGWTRTFAAGDVPATYLVNSRGEFVWRHSGKLDPTSLAKALDEHLVSGPPPVPRQLRLAVSSGQRPLDILMRAVGGETLALRKLRGRQLLLVFWQSWSVPCIRELQYLQDLHEKAGRDGPVVVAINGGESAERIQDICRKYKLSFALVADPNQRIARRYGVICWPTTVSIDGDGIVDGVRFGITNDPSCRKGR